MKFKISLVITAASLWLSLLILALVSIFLSGQRIACSWAVVFFLATEAFLLWGVFDHRSPLFGRNFWRGPKDLPVLSLTFDDGPTEPSTSAILNILKKYQIKATFFVLGKKIELYPETLKKIAEEGQEIGNHGYSHQVGPIKSRSEIKAEIKRTEDLIFALTGKKPVLFRAPHGWKGPWLKKTVSEAGYELISWTSGVWDTDRPGRRKIIERSLKAFKNGAVLLFHDGRGLEENPDCSQLVEALPVIIEAALSQGYQLVTVSQLLELSRSQPKKALKPSRKVKAGE